MKTEKFTEQQEIELAKSASLIEDNIDELDIIERESKHIAELTKFGLELTRRHVLAMRHLEKIERKKAQRSQKRLLFVILVYICRIDPLRAMTLCAMADDGFQEVDGVGVA